MYCPATPFEARCAVTKPSIFPLSQDWCCGPQLWLVDGSVALRETLRREAAARYGELGLGEIVELPQDEAGHVYHMYCVRSTERDRLNTLIDRFSTAGPEGCTRTPHCFFGDLTPDEWAIGMYKHLDHHLRQFNS